MQGGTGDRSLWRAMGGVCSGGGDLVGQGGEGDRTVVRERDEEAQNGSSTLAGVRRR